MLTATRTLKSCSTPLNRGIAHLLHYAQTKLLSEMPQQLKMASYLWLCCAAVRKLHQTTGKDGLGEVVDNFYSHLLQALCNHDPEWWKRCLISDRGILKSDDPIINKLIQPLEYFIEVYGCAYSSN